MVLKRSEVKSFYDRFGKRQDTQGFYENPALNDVVAHASFSEAGKLFEFGCGTGRFAVRLLSEYLPTEATYVGCDLSQTMVNLATAALMPYSGRARVVHTDGTVSFPLPDHSVDRVLSTYVLDLMSETDIEAFFVEAHRVLKSGGRVCLVALTKGETLLSRLVMAIWTSVFHLRASLLGGCRPIALERYISSHRWELEYRSVVVSFGIASEVLVARARQSAQSAAVDTRPPDSN